MVDWTITQHSNAMDKRLGYARVLEEMRDFVRNNAAGNIQINVHQNAPNAAPTTSMTMSANNFTVTQINGNGIHYNYGNLPTFYGADLPTAFNSGGVAVDGLQKAKLLYLFPEAARSTVIEEAFSAAIGSGHGSVVLATYACLVNNYGHTCATVGLDPATPARPLAAADYVQYANTLADGVPARAQILALCQ